MANRHNSRFNRLKNNATFLVTVAFATSLLLSSLIVARLEAHREEVAKVLAARVAADHAAALATSIERALSAAYVLEAIVRQGQGEVPDFDEIAQRMLTYYPVIANLSMSPGGIVQRVVPLKGNEKSIGFNAFQDIGQSREALIALTSRKLTFAGPFEQVQGGFAAYGRLPVYLDSPDGTDKFWGFVSVGLLFPEALSRGRLPELRKQGFHYNLWRIHPNSNQVQSISSSAPGPLEDPVSASVEVPNGQWNLSITPVNGWADNPACAVELSIGLLLSIFVGYATKLAIERSSLNKRLEVTIEGIPDVYWLQNTDGTIVSCNRQFERLCGLKKADVLGKKTSAEILGGKLEMSKRINWSNASDHESQVFERWFEFSDGMSPRLFEVIQTASFDKSGEPIGILSIARDITARKHAEEEIERHRQNLQELVEARTRDVLNSAAAAKRALIDLQQQKEVLDQHAAVIISDVHGIITYANDQFCRVSGYRREELIGRDHFVLQSSEHPMEYLKMVYDSVAKGTTWRGEISSRAKDGHIYWEDCTIAPFLDEYHNLREIVAVRTDISVRKRAEQAASAANRAKSEFLANISHEIRTPLHVIMALLELLDAANLSKEHIDAVRKISDSSKWLLTILNDILDFSKIEAGMMVVEAIPVDLRLIVDGIVGSMTPIADQRGVALTIAIDPLVPKLIIGDPGRIRQVLLNLIGNAVKFSAGIPQRHGRVQIRVENVSTSDGKAGILIGITDNGIGIAECDLPRLFIPFTQADETTTRRFSGTGLGLSISQRLVKMMNGEISVRSHLGTGSEFTVILPVRPAPAGEISSPSTLPGSKGQAQRCHEAPVGTRITAGDPDELKIGGEKSLILVAEDNQLNQEVIAAQLKVLGYESKIATDGVEALNFWRTGRYGLIITDCHMPNLDGFELAKAIRKEERSGTRIPIIAITANAMSDTAKDCASAGMDDYLSKPVLLDGLSAILNKWAPVSHHA